MLWRRTSVGFVVVVVVVLVWVSGFGCLSAGVCAVENEVAEAVVVGGEEGDGTEAEAAGGLGSEGERAAAAAAEEEARC